MSIRKEPLISFLNKSFNDRLFCLCIRSAICEKLLGNIFSEILLILSKKAPKNRGLWRRGRDSNPCGVAPKRFSRPPRYDRFDTSPYMKLSCDRNHQIFNCFRNSFRNVLLCCCRSAEKVRCCKAFQGFCDRCARKFSRPPRYDHFDIPPCTKPTARSA